MLFRSYNTSQQIGGALGLAILSTIATSRTNDALAAAGPHVTNAESSAALVHGFIGAFAGAAVFVAAGGVLLMVLLRPRDLEAIRTDRPITAAAA